MISTPAHELKVGLMWGGGIVALALAATAARRLGFVDHETVTRIVIGAIGLMIAWFGNRMPKAFAPTPLARRVARVGGWSMAISGLVYAAFWLVAPLSTAVTGGCIAIGLGMIVTFGYCLMLRTRIDPV